MNITRFFLWYGFGCRVAPPLMDFLFCVSAHTHNLSVLRAWIHTNTYIHVKKTYKQKIHIIQHFLVVSGVKFDSNVFWVVVYTLKCLCFYGL